jgi:hypothetical protein
VARKPPAPAPSVAEDQLALLGFWMSSDESRLLRVKEDWIGVYVLGSDSRNTSLTYDLEERAGKRVLVEYYGASLELKNPLYEYQLRGDRLELEPLPGATAQYGEDAEREVLNDLGGTWFRVRVNRDAQPGAAPDRGR